MAQSGMAILDHMPAKPASPNGRNAEVAHWRRSSLTPEGYITIDDLLDDAALAATVQAGETFEVGAVTEAIDGNRWKQGGRDQ